jgi:hypothetical protein
MAVNLPDVRVRFPGPLARRDHACDMASTGRTRPAVAATAVVVVMVAGQLLRQTGASTWNTVWAEDGKVYATEAYANAGVSTLLRGYAGYAQFIPRLIALGVRPIPVSWVAPYFAVASALVTALLALFVYRSMHGWVESKWLRASVMLMTALAPVIYFEVNANLANLGWPLVFASFWAFASRREGTADTTLRCSVVVLTGLTTAVLALLVPVAIVVAALRRRRADVIVLVASIAALGVQYLAIRAAGSTANDPSSRRDIPVAYGVRVVASLMFGERWLKPLWLNLGVWLAVMAVVVVLVVVVVGSPRHIDRDRLWFAAVAVVSSLVLFAIPVWIRGTVLVKLTTGVFTGAGSRYGYVPLLVLYSGLVVLVDGTRRRWLVAAVAAQGAALMLVCFGLGNPRSPGPTWSSELATARQRCQAAGPPPAVSIPTTPGGGPWYMVVPCGRLVDASSAR